MAVHKTGTVYVCRKCNKHNISENLPVNKRLKTNLSSTNTFIVVAKHLCSSINIKLTNTPVRVLIDVGSNENVLMNK